MGILFTVVASTLLISAVCSLLEATLYSTRVVTLEAAKAEGKNGRAADRMLKMKRDIATPTAAILILNTIANTAGATFAGMYAADVLGSAFVPAFSAVLTLFILLFSEILPKTYGASAWKAIWPLTTWPLAAMIRMLSPLIWLTRMVSNLAMRTAVTPVVTEDEIRASIRMGAKAGELSASEIQMLESVFHFDDTSCEQVMVPRNEVQYFDIAQPVSSLASLWAQTRHTRYPVCRGGLDELVGMVHAKDLVGIPLTDRLQIEALVRPIGRVPETLSVGRALREMQATHRQILLVVDEYGSTTGLVTLKDILEEIVGTLQDEHAQEEPDIVRTEDGYSVRGNVPLAKVNRELGLDLYDPAVVTLSGLLMKRLGRLLRAGDTVELVGAVAEVREVKANRAAAVHLAMPHRPEDGDESKGDEAAEED